MTWNVTGDLWFAICRWVITRPILRVLPLTCSTVIDEFGMRLSLRFLKSLYDMILMVLPVSMNALTGEFWIETVMLMSLKIGRWFSLNDELLQRTGTSVPLTEYVSLRSELQRLIPQKQHEHMTMSTIENNIKKKKWKNSRFCSLF